MDTAWTLTPIAARTLGLVLVEEGPDETPRWGFPADEARFGRVRREKGHGALAFPEEVPDKAPGPELLIDSADGEPLKRFGRTVVIDERLRKLAKAVRRKTARKKAARAKKAISKAS